VAGNPGRLTRLRDALASAELDGIVVSQPESRRYLSGYSATDLPPRESAGYLFITDTRQYLLTDPRTSALAEAEAPAFTTVVFGAGATARDALRQVAREALPSARPTGPRVGFESGHLTYAVWQAFVSALDGIADLVPAPDLVDSLRVLKDDDELAALRASIALNDAAFAHVIRNVAAGRRERDLAWEIESYYRTHGAEDVSFDPITVSGPNTAIPHAVPSDRTIRPDELVLFDIGARLGGYCSDMTRTFCIETAPDKLREVWSIVLDAQLEAEERVKPGMTGAEVDAVARGVISDAGYGDEFVHGLGHGIGLEIHEPPWISRTRGDMPLQPGMVFSIEPGVYLPGLGGVRIEDLVVLTDRGAEVLTRSPKKLQLSEVLLDLDR